MLRILKILLIPFSLIYLLIISIRNFFYDYHIFNSEKINAKVISIGNITYGGTGKTPTVIYLTRLLQNIGQKPAILSRGYGRQTKGFRLVSDGKKLFCNTINCGDEIIMEALDCNVPAAVSEDRVFGAKRLIEQTFVNTIVLDDAFQHRKIFRDIDVVLLDTEFLSNAKFIDKMLIPSGVFREPLYSLKRADIILLNGKFNEKVIIPNYLKKYLNGKKVFNAYYSIESIYDLKTRKKYELDEFKDEKTLAVSGIAKPDSFFKTLEKFGIELTGKIAFKDHKRYTEENIKFIRKEFYETNAFSIITTEKDAVKLKMFSNELDDVDVFYLKISLNIENEKEFIKIISAKYS